MSNYSSKDSYLGLNKNVKDIDIVIKDINDVFKGVHFAYLNRKTINKDLEEYIISSLKKYSLSKKVILKFYTLGDKKQFNIEQLEDAIHSHFRTREIESKIFLRQQLIQWSINMSIGILFFILCMIIIGILDTFSYIHILKVIKESLLIVNWVALWDPITFILFGWQGINKDILYYKKLSKINICVAEYYKS